MSDYTSRKFVVTLLVVACTTGLALVSKMDANVGLVFAAGIAAYNWANVRQGQDKPDSSF